MRSLIPTISTLGRFTAARKAKRPIRPNPLIPILTATELPPGMNANMTLVKYKCMPAGLQDDGLKQRVYAGPRAIGTRWLLAESVMTVVKKPNAPDSGAPEPAGQT